MEKWTQEENKVMMTDLQPWKEDRNGMVAFISGDCSIYPGVCACLHFLPLGFYDSVLRPYSEAEHGGNL